MFRQLTCCTLLFLAVQAGAQERMPPPNGPPMDEIATAIGLKDAQRSSVQKILEQHHAAMMAMHEAMRSKQDALEQQTHDSLAKVLTSEQLARFDQWHQSHRPPSPDGPGGQGDRRGAQGGPGGKGGPSGGPGGQSRRPPPPQGGEYGQDRPPPPPGNDGDRPPPPPPGGDGYNSPSSG